MKAQPKLGVLLLHDAVHAAHMRSEIHFEGTARAQLMAQLLQATYPCTRTMAD